MRRTCQAHGGFGVSMSFIGFRVQGLNPIMLSCGVLLGLSLGYRLVRPDSVSGHESWLTRFLAPQKPTPQIMHGLESILLITDPYI